MFGLWCKTVILCVIKNEKSVLLVGAGFIFQNGVEKEYDIHNLYSVLPQFKELETDNNLFRQVQVDAGGYGISWNDDLDLDAEDIWDNGTEL